MSINSEVFSLCKYIWKIDLRDKIKMLIQSLYTTDEKDINNTRCRTILSQIARKQNAQFLGYILTHEQREAIEKNINIPVSDLSEEEYVLLQKAHFIIEYLNHQLILQLIKDIPTLNEALDPYCVFKYKAIEFDINELVDVKTFSTLINSFQTIEPLKLINKVPIDLAHKIEQNKYTGVVLEFIKRIEDRGVHDIPEDFLELRNAKLMQGPEQIIQTLFFSVMAIRKIISNIDQMIFQAFIQDKLIVLNEDNIINIIKNNTHMIGRGLSILVQPNSDELFAHPGDIIMVKFQIKDYKIDKLCMIEGIKAKFLNENGDTVEFNLRVLDDNFNPFFGIFR